MRPPPQAGARPRAANTAAVTVAVPPPSTRFWFWAVGRRVDPLYRPWAAAQITSPLYARRRLWPMLAFQTVLIVFPQAVLAVAAHSRWRLVAPAALLVFYVVYAVVVTLRRRPLPERTRWRLLAYHGVTADGTLTTPVSARSLYRNQNPLGKAGLVLFSAQVLIFSSGIAVVADRIAAQRACHRAPAEDLAALSAAVGRPVPVLAAGFGAPAPIVAPGTRLIAAREVDTGIKGLRYIAAYVPGPSGRLLGPAVWRIADPRSALKPDDAIDVGAQDFLARQITPDIGYGGSQPGDRQLDQARDCARAAR